MALPKFPYGMGWLVLLAAVTVVVVVVALVIVFLRTSVDTRPSPVPVVKTYLEAIAAGDATKAASMVDLSGPLTVGSADSSTLTSDKALAGAVERISDIKVDPVGGSSPGLNLVGVGFHYTLGGKSLDSDLNVSWDRKSATWKLVEPWVGGVNVKSPSKPDNSAPEFTISGIANQSSFPDYALYPAIYELDLDPSQFDDGDVVAATTKFTVDPFKETLVDLTK